MAEWKEDKRWSDRFLPEIKSILGQHLIVESPPEDDSQRNTDLMVLRLNAVRIACRIRKPSYIKNKRYANEFTIRAWRPSHNKTELAKILEGFGDYLFYGFSDDKQVRLSKWMLGDLSAFRVFFESHKTERKPPWQVCGNSDRSSTFMAFDPLLIPQFVVASFDIRQIW